MERMELVEYCTSSAWRLKIKWLELPTCEFIDDTVSRLASPQDFSTPKKPAAASTIFTAISARHRGGGWPSLRPLAGTEPRLNASQPATLGPAGCGVLFRRGSGEDGHWSSSGCLMYLE